MQRKTNSAPKNAVRYALVTTATIATILGAQILAFNGKSPSDSTDAADAQSQQSVEDVALDTSPTATLTQQPTDQPSATSILTLTPIPPTGTLPPTNTPAATATTVEAALSQDKQPVIDVTAVSVQNVASGVTKVAASATPTATATTQPTATATVKPSSTAVPTKTAVVTTKITSARSQPNPRSKSSS